MISERFALCAFIAVASLGPLSQARAEPRIEVVRQDGVYLIRAEAVLPVQIRHVWSILTNCALATQFIPHLETCRILAKDPDGRWDVRENTANPPILPRVRTVVRNEYAHMSGFTYKLVSGDLRVSEGSWSLSPSQGGVRIVYIARFEPAINAPEFLVIGAIKNDLPTMFAKLEALSRAQERQR